MSLSREEKREKNGAQCEWQRAAAAARVLSLSPKKCYTRSIIDAIARYCEEESEYKRKREKRIAARPLSLRVADIYGSSERRDFK